MARTVHTGQHHLPPIPPKRSGSQPVPAEQITEVLALTSEIDFLIQLSQCPRWRLRAARANRAGLREQNRFEFLTSSRPFCCSRRPPGGRRGERQDRPPSGQPLNLGSRSMFEKQMILQNILANCLKYALHSQKGGGDQPLSNSRVVF